MHKGIAMTKLFSVFGCISSGKSTISEYIANRLCCPLVKEEFEKNPYLKNYYTDMGKHSYDMQKWFLENRYTQLKSKNKYEFLVQDQILEAFGFIFPSMQARSGIMNVIEYNRISENTDYLIGNLYKQMLEKQYYIYLRVVPEDTDILIDRIKNRGRDFEKSIDEEYLRNLIICYESWYRSVMGYNTIFVVDALKELDHIKGQVTKFLCTEANILV